MMHATVVSVTIFLHRVQTHRSAALHPVVSHLFRFWLWLSTGMVTKEWVAVHRKHHATVETANDPHSPVHKGFWRVLFLGWKLYHEEAQSPETLEEYGKGTPDDWPERHLYSLHIDKRGVFSLGIVVMLGIDLLLFGLSGTATWAVQMITIPFLGAGVVNGIGHYLGYRNFNTDDESRNIPFGVIVLGGEEFHNNHHANQKSARFSYKWWEFDISWMYLCILEFLGLSTIYCRAIRAT